MGFWQQQEWMGLKDLISFPQTYGVKGFLLRLVLQRQMPPVHLVHPLVPAAYCSWVADITIIILLLRDLPNIAHEWPRPKKKTKHPHMQTSLSDSWSLLLAWINFWSLLSCWSDTLLCAAEWERRGRSLWITSQVCVRNLNEGKYALSDVLFCATAVPKSA